jgi:hypothetical protein
MEEVVQNDRDYRKALENRGVFEVEFLKREDPIDGKIYCRLRRLQYGVRLINTGAAPHGRVHLARIRNQSLITAK